MQLEERIVKELKITTIDEIDVITHNFTVDDEDLLKLNMMLCSIISNSLLSFEETEEIDYLDSFVD